VLERKPGALAGSTPLAQSRARGLWPASYDALWAALIGRHGKHARRQLLSPVATTISAGDGQQGVSPTTWRHSVIVVGRLVAVEHISAGAPAGA
jgi:hypothetical protein